MLRLVVIFLIGSLLWMCWWAFGQVAYEKGLSAWVDERREAGWVADYASLETRGFPNRFDTTLTDVALADPATGVAWSAPFLQFLSLSYKPHQVIAVLPETHKFSTPFQTFDIRHDDARASLFLEASTLLGLDRAVFVGAGLELSSTTGARASLKDIRMAAEALPVRENAYRVGAEVLEFQPTGEMRAALDPGGLMPETIDNLRLDADLGFTGPWDRRAIEEARPQITDIKLTDLSAQWGTAGFRAAGSLTVDGEGVPNGRLTVRAEDWRRILDMADAAGVLPLGMRGTLDAALSLLAGENGALDVPLDFEGGQVRLGPISLGEAPRIVIR